MRAWRNAGACAGEPEPWVRTIARREALRVLNRPSAITLTDEHELAGASDQLELVETKLDVARGLRDVSDQERQALFLRHWADKSGEQIARELAIPLGTVKVRLHRAHRKLGRAQGFLRNPE